MTKQFGLIAILLFLISCSAQESGVLKWHVVDVNGSKSSGDAHLIETPAQKYILIDTGYERYTESSLIPYLESLGVTELELVIITHAHKNHYGGLVKLSEKFKINRLAFTPPDNETCDRESYKDRCNKAHVLEVIEILSKNAKIENTESGQVLYTDNNEVKIKVLHQALSINAEGYEKFVAARNQKFTINDSSAVIQLKYGDQSILFAGDIAETTGDYLLENKSEALASTLLAAPHHGVSPLPKKEFFERVNPKAIFVSVSKPPFVGERGKLVRDFAKANDTPLYISGYKGNMIIELTHSNFEVITQADQ